MVKQLVDEIHTLYIALSKTHRSPMEIGQIVNSILLHQGTRKEVLSQAWDVWFAQRGVKTS